MAITTQFLTGFEHGFIGTVAAVAGGGLTGGTTTPGTGWSASTSSPRNGSYCARLVAPANTATQMAFPVPGNPTKLVLRFGVKFVSGVPAAGTVQTILVITNSTPATILTLRRTETGSLQLTYGGQPISSMAPITDTNWHLIEIQLDATAKTYPWKIDGVSQVEFAAAGTTVNHATVFLGTNSTNQPTFTADYDDLIFGTWTNAATDWYGDGKTLAQRAGVDGTHATITSLSPGDAGTAYSGTPTTVNTMVDDPPGTLGWTATRSTTDNIALRTATVGAYAEIKPAVTAETGQANEVRAVMSYSSPATGANLAACDVRNSAGAVTELWGLTGGVGKAYNIVANQFKAALVTKPAAGWTAAEVNAIRFRFGGCTSADINPVPTVQALMLEVDWPISVAGPTYNDTATGTTTATGSGVEVYEPPGIVYTDAQTGVLASSGTALENAAAADTRTSAITATGTALETATASDAHTATIAASGTATESWTVSYTDAATGTISASGTATESASVADSHTGTITTAGASAETAAYTDAQAATATVSGTGLDSHQIGYTDTAAGTIVATGTALETAETADTATGALTLDGTGTETYQPPAGETSYTDATTGTITSSGTALENTAAGDLATGTVAAAGTGADAHTRNTAATGTLTATSTALEDAAANDATTGTLAASGSSIELYQPPTVHTDTAAGTITASGVAADSHTGTDAQTGALAAAGTAVEAATGADAQTGALALAGTKTETATFADATAGTIALTGTSTETWLPPGPQHIDAGTGQLTASGTALEYRTYEDIQAAGPTADGTLEHSATYLDACPGTIHLHGTSTLTTTRNRLRQGHQSTGEPIPPHPAWPTPGTLRRPRRGAHPVGAAGKQRTPA